MGKTIKRGSRNTFRGRGGRPRNRHDLRVSSDLREPVDIKKLGRALVALAQADAERQAMAEHRRSNRSKREPSHDDE